MAKVARAPGVVLSSVEKASGRQGRERYRDDGRSRPGRGDGNRRSEVHVRVECRSRGKSRGGGDVMGLGTCEEVVEERVEPLEPKLAIDRLVKVETSSREDIARADAKARVADEVGSLAKGVMPNFGCGVETDGS